MIYELKTYVPAHGKTTALKDRFLRGAMPLLARHGVRVVSVMEQEEAPGELCYLTCFASEEERSSAWAAFAADADWQDIKRTSESGGPLMASQHTTVYRMLSPMPATSA